MAEPNEPRFRLRFSTGEARTVSGSGLIGRRPRPSEHERVDQIVRVNDHTLSVSKTHLEFGSHEGEFWVVDRYSGNGTIVYRPDATTVECEPGRRYLVPRGCHVDIGQVRFTLS